MNSRLSRTDQGLRATVRMLRLGSTVALCVAAGSAGAQDTPADGARLQQLVEAPQRSPANRARDTYRHPLEDLRFFAIKPTDTVVEILPGGAAYWTEILGALPPRPRSLHRRQPGREPTRRTRRSKGNAAFAAKMAADPADYAKVETAAFTSKRRHRPARDRGRRADLPQRAQLDGGRNGGCGLRQPSIAP